MMLPQAHSERPDVSVPNSDGSTSVREVFAATFYFRQPHATMRAAVAECIQGFHALVPRGGLEYYYDFGGNQEELSEASLANIYERFRSPDSLPNASFLMEGNGVHAPGYSLEYMGAALDNAEMPLEAGWLRFWMPRSFFLQQWADIQAFIAYTTTRLPLSCGSVSPALAGENKPRKQALAARYLGLDISVPGCVAIDLGDKLAGIGWHTLLGAGLVARLGGTARLRAAMPDVFVEELPRGGCRLVLGDEPELGDVNRHEMLPRHRTVAKFVNDAGLLHIPERVVYFVDRNWMADRDAMDKWHRRFL